MTLSFDGLPALVRAPRAGTLRAFVALASVAGAVWLGVGLAWSAHAETPESPLDSAERVAATHEASLETGDLVARLRAIRAAPFGPDPEQALAPLARIAAGRDPSCAAVAAVALRRISSRLDRGTLDAHEADPAALAEAERLLRALVADRSARADIRRLAGLAVSEIAAVRALN
jgi:hypothetical protein